MWVGHIRADGDQRECIVAFGLFVMHCFDTFASYVLLACLGRIPVVRKKADGQIFENVNFKYSILYMRSTAD